MRTQTSDPCPTKSSTFHYFSHLPTLSHYKYSDLGLIPGTPKMSGRIISTSDDGLGSDNPSKIRISLDLVAASGRFLSFLRSLSGSPLPTSRRSIQRYEKLWMPLIADLISSPLMILPPADVHWIWYCHCLHDPTGYREYCALRFGAVIDRPAIIDEENEDYAVHGP